MYPVARSGASHLVEHIGASRPDASYTLARPGVSVPGISHLALDTLSTGALYHGASHPRTPLPRIAIPRTPTGFGRALPGALVTRPFTLVHFKEIYLGASLN